MDGSLDGVAVIVDEVDSDIEAIFGDEAGFLGGELEGAIPDEQQHPTLRRSDRRTDRSRQGIADRCPEDLRDEIDPRWEVLVQEPKQ